MIFTLVLTIRPRHSVDVEAHRQVGALGELHGVVRLTETMRA